MHRLVVITGAGVSTAAGLPDYRGPDGLWTTDPAAEARATLDARNSPSVRRAAWRDLADSPLWSASPTLAHRAIAEAGVPVITTNVDGLHQLAGSAEVVELHGTVRRWQTSNRRRVGPIEQMLERVRAGDDDPHVDGRWTRESTVLFGERLPPKAWAAARGLVIGAMDVLVVGSTLSVEPAASLVTIARRAGARVTLVNQTLPDTMHEVDRHMAGTADVLVPAMLAELLG